MCNIALVGCAMVLLGGIASAEEEAEENARADEQEISENINTGVDYEIYSDFPYPDEGQPQLGPTDVEELLNR